MALGNGGFFDQPCRFKKRKRSNKIPCANRQRRRSQLGILEKLLSLGVDRPTWILHKTLEDTDHGQHGSRLLLTRKKVNPSPLFGMLTKTEQEAVFDESGLNVRAFDRLGREYIMRFKYLKSNKAYRLIGDWSQFLRDNRDEMKVGDDIEIWGFRIMREEGRSEIGMALLHYAKKKEEGEQIGDKRKCEKCVKENGRNSTEDEWMVVLALLELKSSAVLSSN